MVGEAQRLPEGLPVGGSTGDLGRVGIHRGKAGEEERQRRGKAEKRKGREEAMWVREGFGC